MTVLVIADHLDGSLREGTAEAVSAALALGEPVALAVIAGQPAALADAARFAGVDEVLMVAVGAQEFESDCYTNVVEALIADRRPRLVLVPHTVNALSWAAAVSARAGLGFASDVIALEEQDGALIARRALYGGKVHVELEFPDREVVLLTLRGGSWPAASWQGGSVVRDVPASASLSRARHRGYLAAPSGDVDITKADVLLAIGRGVQEEADVERFEELALRLGAVLAVSRPLVDVGWASPARQVGQSGKTVSPRLYIALGISGAFQHQAGMRTARTIVAINTDPEAAIFGIAHYGATCDLFDVADALEEALE